MTEAYLEAQKRRRGSHAEQLQEGELSEKDKAKTYWDEAHGILGCQHYRRGAKLQCSTCNQWATCRHCHDEKEDHKLIRYHVYKTQLIRCRKDTRNMICMHCATPQKAAQYCQNCHIRLARYYCDKCHLWDDHPTKSIYHCADCGICRVGEGLGKDFFHCKTCNVCMSVSLQNSHRCIERNTECDCPICGEYLFTSPETVVFMPCGHSIHQKCYNQHIKTYVLSFAMFIWYWTDRIDVLLVLGLWSTWIIILGFWMLKYEDNLCLLHTIVGRRSYYGVLYHPASTNSQQRLLRKKSCILPLRGT